MSNRNQKKENSKTQT